MATMVLSPWYSPSWSYLQIQPTTEEFECDKAQKVTVQYTAERGSTIKFYHQVGISINVNVYICLICSYWWHIITIQFLNCNMFLYNTNYWNVSETYCWDLKSFWILHSDLSALRKKIYLFHLERIVKHFLNLLTRNMDFQGIRIR